LPLVPEAAQIRFRVFTSIGETVSPDERLNESPRHQGNMSRAILPSLRMTAGMDDHNGRALYFLFPAPIL
jgi:hypothetical protein